MNKNPSQILDNSKFRTNPNILVEKIQQLIEQIAVSRFIEKICRPIDSQQQTEQLVSRQLKKVEYINEMMEHLKKVGLHFRVHTASKNISSSINITSINYKHYIKRIQAKYTQVFINGSFKHYYKIALIKKLSPLTILDPKKWANQALKNMKNQNHCC